MPPTFIIMGVERIALEGPLQISSSALLATHLAPTVSLDWNKGRLVVDLEVSWVSPGHFMKYWGACRDSREKCLESSANCSSLSLENSGGGSSKDNLTGGKYLLYGGAQRAKAKEGGLPILYWTSMRACLSFVKVLFVLFTWTELWSLFTQWSC